MPYFAETTMFLTLPLYYGVIPSLCRTEHCHALPSRELRTPCFARTNLGESLPGQYFALECQNERKPSCTTAKLCTTMRSQNYSNPGAAFTMGNNAAPLLSYSNQSHTQTRQAGATQCLNPKTRSTQCPNEDRQYRNETVLSSTVPLQNVTFHSFTNAKHDSALLRHNLAKQR